MFNTPPQKSLKLILSRDNRCGRLLLLFNILPVIFGPLANRLRHPLDAHAFETKHTWENKSCTNSTPVHSWDNF